MMIECLRCLALAAITAPLEYNTLLLSCSHPSLGSVLTCQALKSWWGGGVGVQPLQATVHIRSIDTYEFVVIAGKLF